MTQSLEKMAQICERQKLADKAAKYWNQALKLAPDNYPGAQNWLKITGREIIKD